MPTQTAGSGSSLVRPNSTNRKRPVWANAIMVAAVTPRAPPEHTTTALSASTSLASPVPFDPGAFAASGWSWLRRVVRLPSACSPTSRSGPPPNNSCSMQAANTSGPRSARCKSMALSDANGHSCAAVFTNPAKLPTRARLLPLNPKLPPQSCTLTNTASPCAARGANARAS